MKKREIKFNALFTAGPNQEIKIIVKDVAIYDHGGFGCHDQKFITALASTDYYLDAGTGQFIKKNDDSCEFNFDSRLVFDHNDWVWFEGVPLQYTGRNDVDSVPLYEGDIFEFKGQFTGVIRQFVITWHVDRFIGTHVGPYASRQIFDLSNSNAKIKYVGNFFTGTTIKNDQ